MATKGEKKQTVIAEEPEMAKQSTSAAESAVSAKANKTTAKKTSTAKRTTTAKAATTDKKATAAKKSTTSSAAKKTTSAAKTTAAKKITAPKKSTAKKAAPKAEVGTPEVTAPVAEQVAEATPVAEPVVTESAFAPESATSEKVKPEVPVDSAPVQSTLPKLAEEGYPGAWWREDNRAAQDTAEEAPRKERKKEKKDKKETAVVPAKTRSVGEARPPVQFPSGVRKSFFSRLVLLLVVAAVLVTSVLIYILRPNAYVEKTDSIAYVYDEQRDVTLVSYNGKSVGEIDGAVDSNASSAKGNISLALAGDTLYLVREDELLEIESDVLDFALAAEGSAFAYRTADEELYWRPSKIKAEASYITDACEDSRYFLSPDGDELAYTRVDEEGVVKMEIESRSGKEPFIADRTGLYPVAVSNGSRFVYFRDAEGGFYVFDSKAEEKVLLADTEDEVNFSALTFNRDFTELMFERNGGTVLYVKGEPQQMGGASSATRFTLLPNRRAAVLPHAFGVQYMVKSFYKNYVVYEVEQGKRLAYFDRKGELVDVSFVDSLESITVTDKGVYYIATDVSANESRSILYRCKNGSDESERISWDVQSYCTNVDGSRLIFVDEQSALYLYRNDKKEPQRLLDKVNPEGLSVTSDDLFCFYREDGELMVSDNGREPRVLATDVSRYFVDGHTLYYLVDDGEGGYDLFANYRNQRKSTQISP